MGNGLLHLPMRLSDSPAAYEKEQFTLRGGSDILPELLNSVVIPRPIALITTISAQEVVNAAPFSYFNIVAVEPCIVAISIQRRDMKRKDTPTNILRSKEFVINICSADLAHIVSIAGGDYPPDLSETQLLRLSLLPSSIVRPPRIANTPVQMECTLERVIEIGTNHDDLILGEVVALHLCKHLLTAEDTVSSSALNPLLRLGNTSYGTLGSCFDIPRGLP
ncbi:MAG: flavin reductase family protein [Chlamydiia bacterium]|nr:flavin reductase family protein [Chlamydiia bacterium]